MQGQENLKDEDNEIEEEEINAALKRVLILLIKICKINC
jgi:hypothetical protein